MKTIVAIVSAICVTTLFGHYYIASEKEKSQLKQALQLADQKYDIANDQIRDLLYTIQDKNIENSDVKQAGYIAGVLDGMNQRENYMEIWHAGYNRANEVQAEAELVEISMEADPPKIESKGK